MGEKSRLRTTPLNFQHHGDSSSQIGAGGATAERGNRDITSSLSAGRGRRKGIGCGGEWARTAGGSTVRGQLWTLTSTDGLASLTKMKTFWVIKYLNIYSTNK